MEFLKAKKFILDKLNKQLPKYLKYHSVEHVRDVYDSAERIAKTEGVKGEELTLLLTAALFHDSGFLDGQKDHEQGSCDLAKEHLPDFGYTDEQIQCICGMIMATKIPQTPHNLLEEIICDADLDYLGREDFFKIGNSLFTELSLYGLIRDEEEWDHLQVRFLEGHHYFTKTSLANRKGKKDEYLAILKSKIHK